MAKTKAKTIIVLLRSVVSGHYWPMRRPRLADKIEIIRYDPYGITSMKISKYPFALVLVRSTVSKHCFPVRKKRGELPLQFVRFDPHAQRWAKYKEAFRLRPLLE